MICKKCNAEFKTYIKIDGIRRNLSSRKYCLTCSPFGLHNTRPIYNSKHSSKNICAYKNCTNNSAYKKFCSPQCKGCHHTALKRKRTKKKAVEYKGGKCQECGYNKCLRSLTFHHLDPSKKEAAISSLFHKSWDYVHKELEKCILLCANCHGEEHERIDI